jgi:hypothetical protein
MSTNEMLANMEAESQRRLRREAQRSRRARESSLDRNLRREQDTIARKAVRRTAKGPSHDRRRSEPWWDHIARLNSGAMKPSVGLQWNRNCKNCGIKVRHNLPFLMIH